MNVEKIRNAENRRRTHPAAGLATTPEALEAAPLVLAPVSAALALAPVPDFDFAIVFVERPGPVDTVAPASLASERETSMISSSSVLCGRGIATVPVMVMTTRTT